MNLDSIGVFSRLQSDLALDRAHGGGGRPQVVGSGGKVVGKPAIGACEKLNLGSRATLVREKKGGPGDRVAFPEHDSLKAGFRGGRRGSVGD